MEIKPNALAIRTLNSINRKRRLQQLHHTHGAAEYVCVCASIDPLSRSLGAESTESRLLMYSLAAHSTCSERGAKRCSCTGCVALTMQPFRPLTALNANLQPQKAALLIPTTAKRVQVTTTPSLLCKRAREMCVRRVFIIWCVGCISFNVFSLFSRGFWNSMNY